MGMPWATYRIHVLEKGTRDQNSLQNDSLIFLSKGSKNHFPCSVNHCESICAEHTLSASPGSGSLEKLKRRASDLVVWSRHSSSHAKTQTLNVQSISWIDQHPNRVINSKYGEEVKAEFLDQNFEFKYAF